MVEKIKIGFFAAVKNFGIECRFTPMTLKTPFVLGHAGCEIEIFTNQPSRNKKQHVKI